MNNDASPRYVLLAALFLVVFLCDIFSQKENPAVGILESKLFGLRNNSRMEVKQARGGSFTYYVEATTLSHLQEGKEVKIYQSSLLQRTIAVEQGESRYTNYLSSTNVFFHGIILALIAFVGGYGYLSIKKQSAS